MLKDVQSFETGKEVANRFLTNLEDIEVRKKKCLKMAQESG